MTFALLKEKLHEYIEQADEKKVQAIYILVESEISNTSAVYDDETIQILEDRRQKFINGNHKGFTVEESIEYVKQNLKKNTL